MARLIRASVFGLAMLVGASLLAAPGLAQSGAFEQLSPGNQKIAHALYEAQKRGAPGLTLDQIAARKQAGTGWNDVFKDMRARGFVEERNLGQVVSGYEKRHPGPEARPGKEPEGVEGARPRSGGLADPDMPGKLVGPGKGAGHGAGAAPSGHSGGRGK